MKIAVMGAGGIGGYVGGRLAQAGEDVSLIARGAHLKALQAVGLHVDTPDGGFHVARIAAAENPADIGPVDIVLFTVKLVDADAAAARIGPLLAPHTRVVTLQNGIDGPGIVARHTGEAAVAAGIIYLAAYIAAPGRITFPGGRQRLMFDGRAGDPTLAGFTAALNRAEGLEAETSDQPDRLIWHKFVGLSAFSALTAASRLPIGPLRENAEAMALYRQLLEEGVAVAARRGHDFDAAYLEDMQAIAQTQPASMKSSLLVDMEAGKPTEAPWLSGRMHALGRELGVPTPAHSALWAVLAPHAQGAAAAGP